MKKFIRALAALVPVAAIVILCGCNDIIAVSGRVTGFQTGDIKSVTVTADQDFTNTVTVDNENTVLLEALQTMLKDAQKPEAEPKEPMHIASFDVEKADLSRAQYEILTLDGQYYAKQDDKLREVSRDDFLEIISALSGFYKHTDIPVATLITAEKEQTAYLTESSYEYTDIAGGLNSPEITDNGEPPVIMLDGNIRPMLEFSQQPKSMTASILKSGETVFGGAWDEVGAYVPAAGGEYDLIITADFDSEHYSGKTVYSAKLVYELPVTFEVLGSDTFPGELVVLKAYNVPNGADISVVTDIDFKPRFFDGGNGVHTAFLPVSVYTAKGEHNVMLSCGDVSQSFKIIENDKQFQIQNMIVSQETANETINSRNANAEYERIIAPLRPLADDTAYYAEKGFVWPAPTSRISTEFGMIRYVNGAPTSSRHNAYDLALPAGTPVEATAAGRVIYAGYLQLTGNTVLIEHGYGLKSWYYHMESLNVEIGDMAEQGQLIGAVGSTGFSTGPHLHFAVSVNGVFINPATLIDTDILR